MAKNDIINELEASKRDGEKFDNLINSVDDAKIASKLHCLYFKLLNSYQLLLVEES